MTGLNPDNDLLMNEQNYRIPQSIDIPMRSQNDFEYQLPLDRIAQYRKNPPTEGISLFSHRVSIPFLKPTFCYCFYCVLTFLVRSKWIQSGCCAGRAWNQIQNLFP